jgi:hypothetical protein
MSRYISKRLDRLEAKAGKRHAVLNTMMQLNTMEDIQDALRRWSELIDGQLGWDRAEYDRLAKLLEPVWNAQLRMTELALREHDGTPLTDEEARELAELKRWCPPNAFSYFFEAAAEAPMHTSIAAIERRLEEIQFALESGA